MIALLSVVVRLHKPSPAFGRVLLVNNRAGGGIVSSIDWLKVGLWLGAAGYSALAWLALVYGATTFLS